MHVRTVGIGLAGLASLASVVVIAGAAASSAGGGVIVACQKPGGLLRVVSNRLRQHGQQSRDKFLTKWKKQQDDPKISSEAERQA